MDSRCPLPDERDEKPGTIHVGIPFLTKIFAQSGLFEAGPSVEDKEVHRWKQHQHPGLKDQDAC
jgi:hypothetical protein